MLGQIHQIDLRVERAAEAYNAATMKLTATKRALRLNTQALHVARANLRSAQGALAQRLVAIYMSQQDRSSLGVILGATSLDDLVNRVETEQSTTHQDAAIIRQVKTARAQISRHQRFLQHARRVQAAAVAARAAERRSIEAQLTQRKALLSTIRGEIAHLQAAERARQLQLAAAAHARLATNPPTGPAPGDLGISASTPGATVAPPSRYGGVVGYAMSRLGMPYVWGAAGPTAFDCSGLVVWSFAQIGVSLPHYTVALWNAGVPVSRDQLQPGDLVFFDGLGHVGIYIGGGQFIHAPHTGDVVKISSLSEGWYAATYVGARRIVG